MQFNTDGALHGECFSKMPKDPKESCRVNGGRSTSNVERREAPTTTGTVPEQPPGAVEPDDFS
jgi:hypothetical protein